jgi:hypothetical protein
MKAERPATGPHATLEKTTDPALKYADPDGYPRASIHPMRFKIVQTPDYVYQLWEYNESWRQIGLNRPHSEVPDISWFGESVGKWEGDTLVVETNGFHDGEWLDRSGSPLTSEAKVTERLRRVNYGLMEVDVTVNDPKAYTKAWTVKLPLVLVLNTELLDDNCLESEKDIPHLVGK